VEKRSESEWTRLIEEQEGSGKSIKGWCREKGLALSTFTKWAKKLRMPKAVLSNGIRWGEVRKAQETNETLSEGSEERKLMKIRYTGIGFEIEVKPGFDSVHLENILQVMSRVNRL